MRGRPGFAARLGHGLPWIVLAAALTLATMPAWRPLLVGVAPSLDDLLAIRCRPG
ncbi:MAG: hypothetical protein INR70_29010 [Parafilimonas terrae]|jgi:hypothetical protein|nr:hypothetical protein [Parafilimonas terrae]